MLIRALYIAAIVGTLLNLINQWPAIKNLENINYLTMGLTYCVPFCVSLFSSWLSEKDHAKHSPADSSIKPNKKRAN